MLIANQAQDYKVLASGVIKILIASLGAMHVLKGCVWLDYACEKLQSKTPLQQADTSFSNQSVITIYLISYLCPHCFPSDVIGENRKINILCSLVLLETLSLWLKKTNKKSSEMDINPNYCMQENFALLKTNSISFVGLYYSVPDVLCGTEKNL